MKSADSSGWDYKAQKFSIRAYWGGRRETMEQTADRMLETFDRWTALGSDLRYWYARPGPDLQPGMPLTKEDLVSMAFDSEDSPRYGHNYHVWNGRNDECLVHIGGRVGKADSKVFGYLSNEIDVRLPPFVQNENGHIINLPVIRAALLTLVRTWDVAWGIVEPEWDYGIFPNEDPGKQAWFRPGWITYLSRQFVDEVELPRSAILEPTEDGGMLIIASEEPLDYDNPDHLKVAADIQAALLPFYARLRPRW